jgi:hypothetical protein
MAVASVATPAVDMKSVYVSMKTGERRDSYEALPSVFKERLKDPSLSLADKQLILSYVKSAEGPARETILKKIDQRLSDMINAFDKASDLSEYMAAQKNAITFIDLIYSSGVDKTRFKVNMILYSKLILKYMDPELHSMLNGMRGNVDDIAKCVDRLTTEAVKLMDMINDEKEPIAKIKLYIRLFAVKLGLLGIGVDDVAYYDQYFHKHIPSLTTDETLQLSFLLQSFETYEKFDDAIAGSTICKHINEDMEGLLKKSDGKPGVFLKSQEYAHIRQFTFSCLKYYYVGSMQNGIKPDNGFIKTLIQDSFLNMNDDNATLLSSYFTTCASGEGNRADEIKQKLEKIKEETLPKSHLAAKSLDDAMDLVDQACKASLSQ